MVGIRQYTKHHKNKLQMEVTGINRDTDGLLKLMTQGISVIQDESATLIKLEDQAGL